MVEFSTNIIAENMYFPNHDTLRIVIEKSAVDFHTIT